MIPCKECLVLARCRCKTVVECSILADWSSALPTHEMTYITSRNKVIKKVLPKCTQVQSYTYQGVKTHDGRPWWFDVRPIRVEEGENGW